MAEAAHYPNRLMNNTKPQSTGMGVAFDMEERLDPKHVKFADGEVFVGVLVAIERITIGGKAATRYRAQDVETDEMVTFNGTFQIDSKLRKTDVGHVIEIRNEGTDPNVSRNGNNMKIFRVRVSKQFAPGWAHDGTPITDDDLPPLSDADVPANARK